jgi:hypothetical protein
MSTKRNRPVAAARPSGVAGVGGGFDGPRGSVIIRYSAVFPEAV